MAIKDERGFWINGRGEPVHKDMIKANEQLRDELVERLIGGAFELSCTISKFKTEANEQVEGYFDLLLQNYNLDEKAKSKKGNFILENFSSTAKIEIRVSELLTFDEKLQVAKMKLDEFLKDETKDSTPIVQTLIMKAFEVDKKGHVDSKKIFALKSYEIRDPRWIEAMEIIDESKKVSSTKSYIRFYTRANTDQDWQIVPLDIAGV